MMRIGVFVVVAVGFVVGLVVGWSGGGGVGVWRGGLLGGEVALCFECGFVGLWCWVSEMIRMPC